MILPNRYFRSWGTVLAGSWELQPYHVKVRYKIYTVCIIHTDPPSLNKYMVLVTHSDVTKNEKCVGMKAEKYGDKIITQ